MGCGVGSVTSMKGDGGGREEEGKRRKQGEI